MSLVDPDELHERAFALYLENRYSAAKKVLLENIARFPDYASSHLLLGQIHFFSRKPNYQAAVSEFREVVRINRIWNEGYQRLGSALEQVGEVENAASSFQEAIKLAPEDSRPRVALGNCFLKMGRYAEAIEMFRKGLELKPYCTEADVRTFLADALAKNDQIEEACCEWRKVIGIEAGWPSDGAPQREAKKMLAKHCSKRIGSLT